MSVNQTGEKTYRLWLITNKHVLKDLREIHLKFNSASEPNSKDYPVALTASNGKARWAGHPTEETDVAAIFLNPQFLRTEGRKFEFWRSDEHTYPKSGLKAQEITEGDRVFVLGFPMGLVAADRQYVICRGGVIARIRDFLENKARDFLVDVTVFPGNSGGPAILCPSAIAITGTKTVTNANLIGIVKSYVPYNDVAISAQTRQPRIVFEENSGLASIESVDAIVETVRLADKRLKGRAAYAKAKQKKKTIANEPQPATPEPK